MDRTPWILMEYTINSFKIKKLWSHEKMTLWFSNNKIREGQGILINDNPYVNSTCIYCTPVDRSNMLKISQCWAIRRYSVESDEIESVMSLLGELSLPSTSIFHGINPPPSVSIEERLAKVEKLLIDLVYAPGGQEFQKAEESYKRYQSESSQ